MTVRRCCRRDDDDRGPPGRRQRDALRFATERRLNGLDVIVTVVVVVLALVRFRASFGQHRKSRVRKVTAGLTCREIVKERERNHADLMRVDHNDTK